MSLRPGYLIPASGGVGEGGRESNPNPAVSACASSRRIASGSGARVRASDGRQRPRLNRWLAMQGGAAMSDVDKPSWWRSATPPLNRPTSGAKSRGRITLPDHLSWSGPTSTFDLDDPAELCVVYATVLREGSQDDVAPGYISRRCWDSLWLPPAVHEAWDGWIREHRLHVAVRAPATDRIAGLLTRRS